LANEAKRRFTAVEVDEVSLVGSPANEVPFHVIKNKQAEDPTMNASAKAQGDTEKVTLAHTTDASEDIVSKCLSSVDKIIGNVVALAKSSGAAPATTVEDTDVEKNLTAVSEVLAANGVTGDALKAALSGLEKAFPDFLKKPKGAKAKADAEEEKNAKTKKSADEEEGSAATDLVAMLSKAARLTPSRMEKLSQAADLLKLVIEGVGHGESPDTKAPKGSVPASGIQSQVAKGDEDGVTAVAKSLENVTTQVADGFQKITATLKSLTDRLEAVETAKPASDSASGNSTDTKTTKSKSLFAGVV
jgi:hypothetical protein